MNYHAESQIALTDQSFFYGLRRVLEKIQVPDNTSCHDMAEAIAIVFPQLKRYDGFFSKIWQHSWLQTESYNIIDPYPIGLIGGPLLLDGIDGPWKLIYYGGTTLRWLHEPDRVNEIAKQIRLRM